MSDSRQRRGEQQLDQEVDRLKEEQRIDDFRWLMNQPQGRRYIHGLLQSTGVYLKSYTGNSETFYREGRRSIGLETLGDINALCPEKFITMLEEQQNDRRSTDDRTD